MNIFVWLIFSCSIFKFIKMLKLAFWVIFYKVSQRLMVQGYSGHVAYSGGLDVVRKVIKSDGIRGLYRGFGLSIMTYSPSSAVWWASYGSSQRVIWRYAYSSCFHVSILPIFVFIAAPVDCLVYSCLI